MLGVGSPTAGGDPLLSTTAAGGARGNYAVKLESGSSALEELLSCLQALPLSHPHQSWQLRQHQDSITKNIHVQVSVMEQVHGVDVSWLHRPHKDHLHRKPARPSTQNGAQQSAEAESGARPHEAEAEVFPERRKSNAVNALRQVTTAPSAPPHISPKKATHRPSIAPTQQETSSRPSPLALSRSISEPLREKGKPNSRRSSSWISSLGNKFSSDKKSSQPAPSAATATQQNLAPPAGQSGSSVFSSISRKLSTPQINAAAGKAAKGGVCERRILNVDPNRQRCLLPEMDAGRLRKVSFCVDVEIAGGPRFFDDEDLEERKQMKKDAKLKERAEGEALKNPEALQKANDELAGAPSMNVDAELAAAEGDAEDGPQQNEKKKRTDEERRARQEKRRRRAEENGSIPLEFVVDSDDSSVDPKSMGPSPRASSIKSTSPPAATHERPTSDPARIYRRCCQLRETPILKRITEQLMSPTCCTALEPGVVQCLDLKGSRLQLADMVTLGDWLAVVPVKKLLLEDADMTDEGLRCILAGLLSAKQPRPKRRRNSNPKHRAGIKPVRFQERSGIVEKLTLKNNPRITRVGWKHIALFLYMCRSIKAIDLSMIQFPDTFPMSPSKSTPNTSKNMSAADLFFKCLTERLGGSQLEELSVSECGMNAAQIGRVVDAAVKCGISRLGLAGNHIDDEGLEHVLHYLRSGVCACLDIGGNDLRGKLGLIADALSAEAKTKCWGLSLAACNLDTASLKPLFPTLQRLPNFRFIDLSHNQDLCGRDDGTISLLRRYLGQMKHLKRIHLADVGMSSKQAITLADVLAEAPQLAHISIIENPEISALASAHDEASQEEACALYASLMAAVRCSSTLICIDIDVPTAENGEIVRALAKQVVAYSLRNMERFAIAEATGMLDTSSAAAALAEPHGGERHVREVIVPDILMSLVGHVDGVSENHDGDEPAPDEDYIVGGAGVVKALQYILGEKANDLRRSVPNTPVVGARKERPSSSHGVGEAQLGRAKKMSTNLLNSARKIRSRLQPALVREEASGDEMAYRRLVFLDETLRNMIQRFEEEYPETRVVPPSPRMSPADAAFVRKHSGSLVINTNLDEAITKSDDEDISDDERAFRPHVDRNNSEVSLASRALALEEGQFHRLGQRLRREVVDSPASAFAPSSDLWQVKEEEQQRLRALQERVEGISGSELKALVDRNGWERTLAKLGANAADLRGLQEQDPQGWEMFVESQLKARLNAEQHTR